MSRMAEYAPRAIGYFADGLFALSAGSKVAELNPQQRGVREVFCHRASVRTSTRFVELTEIKMKTIG